MKKKLTIKEAEKIVKKTFSKVKNRVDREHYLIHSKHVSETALILASKKKVDKNILKIAGLVHDLGRTINSKDHAIHSVKFLEKKGYELSETLKDCILNHGSLKIPKSEEGKIIQMADKVCFFNPEVINLIIKSNNKKIQQNDIDILKEKTTKAITALENYKID